MLVSFVKAYPALLIKRERVLVVGDLHIGMHLKLRESGVYFQNATERMTQSLRAAYAKSRARSIVLLGDVKESITSPTFAGYKELRTFFGALSGIDMRIVKGNHDGDLPMVMRNLGFQIPVEKEIIVGNVALTHGNAWPSQEAMGAGCLVVGHGHYALRRGESTEKAWLVSKVTTKAAQRYKSYNKRMELVVVPSFNELVIGSRIGVETKGYLPLFKNGVFSFEKAEVYDLDGTLAGRVSSIIRQG